MKLLQFHISIFLVALFFLPSISRKVIIMMSLAISDCFGCCLYWQTTQHSFGCTQFMWLCRFTFARVQNWCEQRKKNLFTEMIDDGKKGEAMAIDSETLSPTIINFVCFVCSPFLPLLFSAIVPLCSLFYFTKMCAFVVADLFVFYPWHSSLLCADFTWFQNFSADLSLSRSVNDWMSENETKKKEETQLLSTRKKQQITINKKLLQQNNNTNTQLTTRSIVCLSVRKVNTEKNYRRRI